jgi:hypothetical protein
MRSRRRLAHAAAAVAVARHRPSLSRGPLAPFRRPARARSSVHIDRQLHRRPSDTGAALTPSAATGSSAPFPDATGARPDPAGVRFTG